MIYGGIVMNKNANYPEQYSELMIQQKGIAALSKLVTIITIIVLLLVGIICSSINSIFLSPSTAKDIIFDNFNSGKLKYPIVKSQLSYDNGYSIISVYAISQEDGLNNLKSAYSDMKRKFTSKKLDTLSIVVYDKNDVVLFSSRITISELKNTDWVKSMSYKEFENLANVSRS